MRMLPSATPWHRSARAFPTVWLTGMSPALAPAMSRKLSDRSHGCRHRLGCCGVTADALRRSFATDQQSGEARKRFVNHLPQWAKDEERPSTVLKVAGGALLLPLIYGSFAVHALAGDGQEGEGQAEYSRDVLSYTIHYAGGLLSFNAALHWGMQLAEFGVPRQSEYMALYYLSRYSAPVVFVFFGWLGSVMSSSVPEDACMFLITGYVGMMSCDFVATIVSVAPVWWFKWKAGFCACAIASLLLLMFSERNVYLGQTPMLRM
uniref:Uncharacterized protein n=1 Tax=Noctiluca scintillans TaxID=2966 RepID=A0A7S1F5T2_NOCSC